MCFLYHITYNRIHKVSGCDVKRFSEGPRLLLQNLVNNRILLHTHYALLYTQLRCCVI